MNHHASNSTADISIDSTAPSGVSASGESQSLNDAVEAAVAVAESYTKSEHYSNGGSGMVHNPLDAAAANSAALDAAARLAAAASLDEEAVAAAAAAAVHPHDSYDDDQPPHTLSI